MCVGLLALLCCFFWRRRFLKTQETLNVLLSTLGISVRRATPWYGTRCKIQDTRNFISGTKHIVKTHQESGYVVMWEEGIATKPQVYLQ